MHFEDALRKLEMRYAKKQGLRRHPRQAVLFLSGFSLFPLLPYVTSVFKTTSKIGGGKAEMTKGPQIEGTIFFPLKKKLITKYPNFGVHCIVAFFKSRVLPSLSSVDSGEPWEFYKKLYKYTVVCSAHSPGAHYFSVQKFIYFFSLRGP